METSDGFTDDAREPSRLPFIDEHAILIAASRERVWTALRRYAGTSLTLAEGRPPARILGTEPPSGWTVAESAPAERLTLVGRHRFARYRLAFELTDAHEGATRARSWAEFPDLRGRVYRAAVIGTRAHVIATHHVLRSIRRRSIEATASEKPPA